VIENVVGMMRVWPRVAAMLRRRLPGYRVLVVRLDPSRNFGEPVRRPRIYIILVRLDATCVEDAESAAELARHMLRAMERPDGETTLSDRLLPDDHALVREPRAAARKAFESWRRRTRERLGGAPPGASCASSTAPAPRWASRHAAARAAAPRGSALAARPQASEDELFLTSARERDMWRVVSHQSGSGRGFSIDLSQSISHTARGADNILPTITPRGRVVLADRRRLMMPAEKLLIHGFPLHRMLRPSGLSDAALSRLGGNTMQVQCIASAMLLGLAQVNWGALAAACPRQGNAGARGSGRRAAERPIAIDVVLPR
jgi:site-specific DNA-cytosine methylase